MSNLRSRLPPVNSLIAFEASARLGSFTRAGEEMTISREAVSRHIRLLESHLGTPLFTRKHRAIELTRAGSEFQTVVHKALEDIARSADGLKETGRRPKVAVTATVAIASFWLTPRLPTFRAQHPDAELRVIVSDAPVERTSDDADICLRYGDGTWPGFDVVHLFDTSTFPVCAPDYAETAGAIEAPGDLTRHTLLNLDGAQHAVEDWTWWFEGHGIEPPARLRMLGFDNYANVIQAAADGQGVALGFSGIIDHLMVKGSLVRPFDDDLSKGLGVYALVRSGTRLKPAARKFFDWVLSEAGV